MIPITMKFLLLVGGLAFFSIGCNQSNFAMHDAVREANLEKVRNLIQENPRLVLSKDADLVTPLHLASGFGFDEMATVLLAHGAQANAKDRDGQTPLYWAARQGHREIVKLLLAHGANVDAKDTTGKSASQVASEWGYQEVVQLLADHYAKDAIVLMPVKVPDLPKVELVALKALEQKESVAQPAPEFLSTSNLPLTSSCGCGGAK